MNDSFLILGLKPGASKIAIRMAYRKLAKTYHPDQPSGDAQKFVQIRKAYESLLRHTASQIIKPENKPYQFLHRFSRKPRTVPMPPAKRGADIHICLEIHLDDLMKGAIRQLTLPSGRSIEFQIPKGHSVDTKFKLKGMGEAGKRGGASGDLLIELQLKPQKQLRLEGRDLHMELALPLWTLRSGSIEQIRTPAGRVKLHISPLSNPGTVLKLKQKGLPANDKVPAGDLFVQLHEQPATGITIALDQFAKRFHSKAHHCSGYLRSGARSALTKP